MLRNFLFITMKSDKNHILWQVLIFHSLLNINTKCGLEEVKIVMLCSVTATSDSQLRIFTCFYPTT